jgi:GAF domain-containing protein
MANQVSTAIDNSQLYERASKRVSVLNTLYEAGRVVISSLELGEILNRLAEQAWHLTIYQGKKISFAGIRLVEGAKIKLVAIYPPEEDSKTNPGNREIDLSREDEALWGVVGRAIKTGQPQLVGSASLTPGNGGDRLQPRSELAVPIKLGQEVIGAINVAHPDYNAFDLEDQYALESLAAQAAIAIQNARLFRETQRHARLLRAAAQVARGATSILDEDKLLTEAVKLIVDSFDFLYHAGVFLLDDKREYAVLRVASSEGGQRMLARGHELKVGQQGIVGFVTHSGQPRLTPDVREDAHHFVNPDLPATRAEMAFPLITRDGVIGALDVQSTEVVNLSDEDVATLQTMADQLAIAIENARRYESEQRRVRELSGLNRISQAIGALTDIHQVYQLINMSIAELAGAEMCAILLHDETREVLVCQLPAYGVPDELGRQYRIPFTKDGLAYAIWRARSHLILNNVSENPLLTELGLTKLAEAADLRDTLLVKLTVGNREIGVIQASNKQDGTVFSEDDARLLSIFAGHAAAVIENAGLYEKLKQAHRLVSARTGLAWMGMANSAWRHSVDKHALTIREQTQLLHRKLKKFLPEEQLLKFEDRLSMIERVAGKILEKPLTLPLSAEAGIESVAVNELVSERANQLWQNDPYQITELRLELNLPVTATVRVSPEWLRRAFDILVDNAVNALADCQTWQIEIGTRAAGSRAEIFVSDTGSGLPPHILHKIGVEFIQKPEDSKGLGMGLVMAQTIVQTYGGEVVVGSTGPNGTTMVIELPLEKNDAPY